MCKYFLCIPATAKADQTMVEYTRHIDISLCFDDIVPISVTEPKSMCKKKKKKTRSLIRTTESLIIQTLNCGREYYGQEIILCSLEDNILNQVASLGNNAIHRIQAA